MSTQSTFKAILLMALLSVSAYSKVPHIKVRIGKNLKQVRVSGLDIQKEINGNQKLKTYLGQKRLHFNCLTLKKMKRLSQPLLLASLSSPTGLIRWDKNAYTGKLNLLAAVGQKGCDLINEISLESYLHTLLAKEMNASWPLEALKAQAVAARSYAYHKIKTQQVSKSKGYQTYYDLENSEKHQVNGQFFDSTKRTEKAAKETYGEMLTLSSGKVTPIFFHAKCGGKTLKPSQVWSHKVEGYESVECPFCHKYGKRDWKLELPQRRFNLTVDKALKNFYNDRLVKTNNEQMRMVPDSKARTNIRVYDEDRLLAIQKSRIRSVLGRKQAPSNYYHLEKKNNKIILKGKGYGHGVGMCQLGALELAKRGYTYKQILAHYFPKHILKKQY